MKPHADKQVWFVSGTLELYGPESFRRVSEQSQEVVAHLNASDDIPVTVLWKTALADTASIRRVFLEANSDDSCVGVIAWMHTFSPSKLWIPGLKALAKPLLHLHTQYNLELPFETIDQTFMNLNQAAHGDREFSYMLTRMGRQRKIVTGHVSSSRVQREVGTWCRAAVGVDELSRLTIGQFGNNMRGVGDTDGDKVGLQLAFGTTVDAYSVSDVQAYVAAVPDNDVDALLDAYAEQYTISPALQIRGDRHDQLRDAARQEAGIRRFLEEHRLGAWVSSFMDLDGLRQLPGFAAQRLMADGYGYGPEGDWKTPMLIRAAKVMGKGLPGGSSLIEDYTYHLEDGNEGLLGSHMIELCETLTTAKPRLETNPLSFIHGKEETVRLVFDADPAEGASLVSIVDLGGRFRLVGNVVDVVAPDAPMQHLPSARAYWRPRPDFHTAMREWLGYGGGHHEVLTTAVGMDVFKDLADILGVELCVTR